MPQFGRKDENGPDDKKRMLPKIPKVPKINTEKLKGSLKCISWVQRKIQSKGILFPLFMVLLNALYLTLGGLIFMALERTPKPSVNSSQELVDLFDTLKTSDIGNLTIPAGVSGSDIVANLSSADLTKLEGLLGQVSDVRAAAGKSEWSILNSIFFCMTVVTTIGYGHLSPVTFWGRIVCVMYALIGIPLTLALLAIIGKILGDYINQGVGMFLKGFQRFCPDYEYEGRSSSSGSDDSEVDAPLWVALLFLAVFMSIMGVLYCLIEGWDFGTAFYFTFVTFLTIGFGDVVPEKESLVFINIVLTLLGLSFLSITLSLIASNISSQMKKAAFLAKKEDQELSDISNAGIEYEEQGNPQKRDSPSEDNRPITGDDSNGGKKYGSTGDSP